MRIAAATVLFVAISIVGCNTCDYNRSTAPGYDELPGLPINTIEYSNPEDGDMSRSRGVVDIKLRPDKRSITFYNDRETQTDPWGTITLVGVSGCCKATIAFGGKTITARPGKVFPGTGFYLVNASPDEGSVWIRSRWTHTIMRKWERQQHRIPLLIGHTDCP